MGTRGRSARWILASLPLAGCYDAGGLTEIIEAGAGYATQSTGEASGGDGSMTSPISTVTSISGGSEGDDGSGSGSAGESESGQDLPPTIALTINGSAEPQVIAAASVITIEALPGDSQSIDEVVFFLGDEQIGEPDKDAPYVVEKHIDSDAHNGIMTFRAVAKAGAQESAPAELKVQVALPKGGVGVWDWFDTKLPGAFLDVAVDGAGYTTAVGYQLAQKGDLKRWHATIRQFNVDGELLWERLYPDPMLDGAANGRNIAYGVAVDSIGNVAVVGDHTDGAVTQAFTLRFAPEGVRYSAKLRGPGTHARDVAIASDDSMAIVGFEDLPGDGARAIIWTHNEDGTPRTVTAYMAPDMTRTIARGLVLDPDDEQRIYAVGRASVNEAEARGFVLGVDGGVIGWQRPNIGDPKEVAFGVAFAAKDELVVVGRRAASNGLLTLRKFDATSGAELVSSVHFDSSARCSDDGCGIAVDGGGHLLVAGAIYDAKTKYDVLVKKFGPDGYQTKWASFSDMQAGEDLSYAVVVDGLGFVYASGMVTLGGQSYAWVSKINP